MPEVIEIPGWAFLAQSSRRTDAVLRFEDSTVSLIESDGAVISKFDRPNVRFAAPLGQTNRRVELPGGTLFETEHTDLVERATGRSMGDALNTAERFHPRLVAVVLAALGGAFLVWRFALPALVWLAVLLTPETLRDAIDRGSLSALDLALAETTTLSAERQAEVETLFDTLVAELPPDQTRRDFILEFRDIPGIGPNAAALPGGTVVITDALVKQFGGDHVIAAVLGHELGHVVEDHGLKQLYRSVGVFLLISLIAGDPGPILEDVLLEGGVIMSLSFSRQHEKDADAFGLRLTRDAGFDPAGLIEFFEALPDADQTQSGWKSTHPASGARIEAIREFLREN